mmetsp:Transcript_14164/g.39620  ORF Transcript_14164/g.39620 Transcript_14164/m.39620 type:complete len:295 (-) Transcript_14164:349-1233(-)
MPVSDSGIVPVNLLLKRSIRLRLVHLPSEFGIVPSNWLPYISKFSNATSSPIPSGIVPFTYVLESKSSFRLVIFSSEEDIVPVKALILRWSFSILYNLKSSSGMVPSNLHPAISRYFRLVKRPISLGNAPVIIGQPLTSRYLRFVNLPISLGRGPLKYCRRLKVRTSRCVSLEISAGIPLHSFAGAALRSPVTHMAASVRSILVTLPPVHDAPFKSHLSTDNSAQLSNCNPQFLPPVYVYKRRRTSRSVSTPSPFMSPCTNFVLLLCFPHRTPPSVLAKTRSSPCRTGHGRQPA